MKSPTPLSGADGGRLTVALAATTMLMLAVADDVPVDSLPQLLLDKLQRLYPGTEVHEVEREETDGEQLWEVTLRAPGSKLETEINLLEDATITEIEEDLPADGLPQQVALAIRGAFPGAVIDEAARRHRVEITYEVEIDEEGGGEKELRLTRHGKILSVKND